MNSDEVMDNDQKAELVRQWFKIKRDLQNIQDEERELRRLLIDEYFGEELSKGTTTVKINDNAELKLTVTTRITVDPDVFEEKKTLMEAKGLIGPNGAIKYEPKVSVTAMKKMSKSDMMMFQDVFVEKQDAPQLKLELKGK